MATRKYTYHKCEVVDGYEIPLFNPLTVFGYGKISNGSRVFVDDGTLKLTPVNGSETFVDGDVILVKVLKEYTGSVSFVIGGNEYPVQTPDGESVDTLGIGYKAFKYVDSAFRLDDLDLDHQEYVYCDLIIAGCIKAAENYMHYDITPKKYREFRNDLTGDYIDTNGLYDDVDGYVFELRRGIVSDSVSITYTDTSGSYHTLDTSDYYVYNDKVIVSGEYPTANKLGVVCIEYEVWNEIGADLAAALLQHITEAYESRGMCTSESCPAAMLGMSSGVKSVYDLYRRVRIGE